MEIVARVLAGVVGFGLLLLVYAVTNIRSQIVGYFVLIGCFTTGAVLAEQIIQRVKKRLGG